MFRSVICAAVVCAGLSAASPAYADVVTYSVDATQSRLTLTGSVRYYFNGSVFGFNPVADGSMETAFGGSITGDLDGSTLTLSGGSSVFALANPAGPFPPTGPGAVDAFGMRTFANGGAVADNRMYDISLDLLSGVLVSGGAFNGAVAYSGLSGGVFPFFDATPRSLAGVTANNTASDTVTLTTDGVVETLTIPISTNLILFGNGTGVETRLTGTIIATRDVPAPGAAVLLALGGLAARRHRR